MIQPSNKNKVKNKCHPCNQNIQKLCSYQRVNFKREGTQRTIFNASLTKLAAKSSFTQKTGYACYSLICSDEASPNRPAKRTHRYREERRSRGGCPQSPLRSGPSAAPSLAVRGHRPGHGSGAGRARDFASGRKAGASRSPAAVLPAPRNLRTRCLPRSTPGATFAWEPTVQSVVGEGKGHAAAGETKILVSKIAFVSAAPGNRANPSEASAGRSPSHQQAGRSWGIPRPLQRDLLQSSQSPRQALQTGRTHRKRAGSVPGRGRDAWVLPPARSHALTLSRAFPGQQGQATLARLRKVLQGGPRSDCKGL